MEQNGVIIEEGLRDWQILQWDAAGVASVTLSGRWVQPDFLSPLVRARVAWEDSAQSVASALDWVEAEMLTGHQWRATLAGIPAGGLYRVETHLAPDRAAAREWCFHGDIIYHLGVGDLYVIAGQSNSAGYGRGAVHDPPELGIHLSPAANMSLGLRLADVCLGALHGGPVPWRAPEVTTATAAPDGRPVELESANVTDRMATLDPTANPFRVDDSEGTVDIAEVRYPSRDTVVLELVRPLRGEARVHGAARSDPPAAPFDVGRMLPCSDSTACGSGRNRPLGFDSDLTFPYTSLIPFAKEESWRNET